MSNLFIQKIDELSVAEPARIVGRVKQVIGYTIECAGLNVPVGSLCAIKTAREGDVETEVVGFKDERAILMPFSEIRGVSLGDPVECVSLTQLMPVGEALLGRVLDGRGHPTDDKGPIFTHEHYPVYADPPHPLKRTRISKPLSTGIRAIDSLITVGRGQRIGIFSGSGVGKSVLLGMMAKFTDADVNVIALVGERGREVREFIERDLGEEGLARSVVIVATSDKPALERVKAPFLASAVAEYFRDQGKDVNLLMDSTTRMAMAQREIGLAVGEPPATKGYTPSVFALMPRLLERSGCGEIGSITGFYTVLVDADDFNEPISDAMRGILDGHIVLARKLAHRGHYPAIDPLQSISRVMKDVISEDHVQAAQKVNEIIAEYRDAEGLINVGAYQKGSNPKIDYACSKIDAVNDFLKQGMNDRAEFVDTVKKLFAIFEK